MDNPAKFRPVKGRRFCCARHRAAWHTARKRRQLDRIRAIVAELSSLLAEMEGK
jgi:hypothetical protein